jgi:hypothetical protein
VACIAGLLARLAPSIQSQLAPNLGGLRGLIVRGYLPQTWVLSDGAEYASLVVAQNGTVTAHSGAVQSPDVLIASTHDVLSTALEAALGQRSRDQVVRGPVTPTFYTPKGRTAFNFLRGRLGL